MTSLLWDQEPLLDKGFYYLMKSEIMHLKVGMRVRVMNAQYHQAPKSDDGGYLVDFPDMESLRLDHDDDRDLIKNISSYLEKQEQFDWDQAMQELKANRTEAIQQIQEDTKKETYLKNKKTEKLVQELVAKGMTPKAAYKYIQANRLIR